MGEGRPTEQGMAAVQGGALAYEVRGAGPSLTLLHPDGLDRRMWDDQFAAFADRYRVLRYDARGHGASPRSLERRAPVRDMVGLLRAAGIGPTALLGIDVGGGTAIDFALARPDLVTALVLVASSLPGWLPPGRDMRDMMAVMFEKMAPMMPALERAVATGDPTDLIEAIMDDPAMALTRPAARERVRAMLTDNIHQFLPPFSPPPLPTGPPASARLDAIRAPTLVLVGERDNPAYREVAEAIATGVAGARLVVVPDAPRLINMERPEEFNRIVLDFLGGVLKPA